ncbi:crotonobetainyl-CoA:carnitine CoA-transferase CaiB-like acyl-CoA transferase [Neorhizobium galegae]|uniref:CaiB/BaiF CoA transferase family protein n=1 Tax=Neorhizobium galegae TaxID=399 RepID=UPI00277F6F86|nr:CaiB/BaiF CoA-transferase family protein [Neorhizobium galegae]MDQ0138067.1 crotonobetainyl-CoA:carnitine CoA-transferase CaiB-like acyl-CoA transferase [Neorhizobium galegae]
MQPDDELDKTANAALPLTGIKVLDLSRVLAGPSATMTLGDLGADVWKVEQPGTGDDTRTWAPPSASGIATYYLAANRNKRSIAVDLATPEGRQIVLRLAAQADIVVENFRPASLRKLGLTYDELRAVNPRLIHCSISGYGRGNDLEDRPGYDFILQAECGFMSITGEPDGEPMRLGVAFVDLVSGMNAVQAILAALFMRERTGRGQWLDIALFDSAVFFLANVASGHLNTGSEPRRFGNAHPSIVPYQLFDCADGRIALAVGNDEQFRRLCLDVLPLPGLAADERFASNRRRAENRDLLLPILSGHFSTTSRAEMLGRLERAGIPAGEVKSVGEALRSQPSVLRDSIVTSPHPVLGETKSIRSPLRMSAAPMPAPSAPPLLGQHTDMILSQVLGFQPDQIDALRGGGIVQ